MLSGHSLNGRIHKYLAYSIHLLTVVKTAQMGHAVRQQAQRMFCGLLPVQQAFSAQCVE